MAAPLFHWLRHSQNEGSDDLIGDRQSMATSSDKTLYGYAANSHRLLDVGGKMRVYDAVGNLIEDDSGGRSYVYGDYNRMSAFSGLGGRVGAEYTYNGRGERVVKAVHSKDSTQQVLFVYDEAGRLLSELVYPEKGGSLVVRREYIYLEGIPVAVVDYQSGAISPSQSGQTTYYVHADHLGTPRAVTDARGTKRWEWQFRSNPFGEVQANEDPERTGENFTLNLRFPGQHYDSESGLHYNYFRDYEPQTGRYVQSDPIGLDGGLSTYTYVDSNPFGFSDRFGLLKMCHRNVRGPLPGRHCYASFEDGSTLSYSTKGLGPDPYSDADDNVCTDEVGSGFDDCVKREMQNCQAENYSFTKFNCCHCVEQAMKACGASLSSDLWPNGIFNPGPQPDEPGYSPDPVYGPGLGDLGDG